MGNWFVNNAGTIIISLLLIGIVVSVIGRLRKDRKQGKCSCGGNCGSCPMGGSCHREA